MIDRTELERKQVWLWLFCAWATIPALTTLAVWRLGDYSAGALWRWAFLVLGNLVAPTMVSLQHYRRIRVLERDHPAIQSHTIRHLLRPGWQLLMQAVITTVALMALYIYYDR